MGRWTTTQIVPEMFRAAKALIHVPSTTLAFAQVSAASILAKLAIDVSLPLLARALFASAQTPLVRFQFRRVRWQRFKVEAGKGGAERPDNGPLMDVPVVPDDDHGAGKVPEDVPDEGADLRGVEVGVVHLDVEAEALAAGAGGQARDGGDPLVALPGAQHRGLADRRPGATDAGNEQEVRFVYEDEVGALPCSGFFVGGHAEGFHGVMAASFR